MAGQTEIYFVATLFQLYNRAMQKLVSILFQEYLSTQKLAANSVAIKQRAFKYFISTCGDCLLPSDDKMLFEKYVILLQAKTTPRTAETYKRNLSSFISWLVRHNYLKDQCRVVSQTKYVPLRPVVSFSTSELRRVFEVADEQWRVIIIFGLCGLRRSEILNLCKDDIDLQGGYVFIAPKIDSMSTWEWDNKNCAKSSVPLPINISLGSFQVWPHDEIRGLLKLIPAEQPYICLRPKHYLCTIIKKEKGIISFEDRNCPWRSFTRDFGLLLKKAEVDHKRFEDLRITYGMSLAQGNIDVESAQALLRHSKICTTYGHYQQYKSKIGEAALYSQVKIYRSKSDVPE